MRDWRSGLLVGRRREGRRKERDSDEIGGLNSVKNRGKQNRKKEKKNLLKGHDSSTCTNN